MTDVFYFTIPLTILALICCSAGRFLVRILRQQRPIVVLRGRIEMGILVALSVQALLLMVTSIGSAPASVPAVSPPVLLLDGLAGTMLLVVSVIGAVVFNFARRYLAGEEQLQDFAISFSLTLAAIALMIVSGHLAITTLAWCLTGIGVTLLLRHYSHDKAADRSARTWLTFSLLGDGCMVFATAVAWLTWQSASFESLPASLATNPVIGGFVLVLVVFAVALKSGLAPFHVWLPESLHAPTPVSALLHAGVLNSGGYLLMRLSPALESFAVPMILLGCFGLGSILLGGLSMMAQSSIKKKLVYSTMAQMGFMMLQCALGAYSLAMLHLIGHAIYKSYRFLDSGYLPETSQAGGSTGRYPLRPLISDWLIGLAIVFATLMAMDRLFHTHVLDQPGSLVLSGILVMTLTVFLVRPTTEVRSATLRFRSLLVRVALLAFVVVAYKSTMGYFDAYFNWPDPSQQNVARWLISMLTIVAFGSLFYVDFQQVSKLPAPWLHALRTHARSGFYVEAMWYRLTQRT